MTSRATCTALLLLVGLLSTACDDDDVAMTVEARPIDAPPPDAGVQADVPMNLDVPDDLPNSEVASPDAHADRGVFPPPDVALSLCEIPCLAELERACPFGDSCIEERVPYYQIYNDFRRRYSTGLLLCSFTNIVSPHYGASAFLAFQRPDGSRCYTFTKTVVAGTQPEELRGTFFGWRDSSDIEVGKGSQDKQTGALSMTCTGDAKVYDQAAIMKCAAGVAVFQPSVWGDPPPSPIPCTPGVDAGACTSEARR
jgi:hypothetical protein